MLLNTTDIIHEERNEDSMIYREFDKLKLSTLGFGGMRLPTDEKTKQICEEEAAQMIDYAYNNGVNFFDTAYFYLEGKSEGFIGNTLSKFPRDTWYLSNKFPGNMMDIIDDKLVMDVESIGMEKKVFNNPAEVFEYQLKNCGVDYFDFYMLHNVSESTYDLYTNENIGIIDYLFGEKKAGRIRHLGFSTHGRYTTIEKFLNHCDSMEFVLLQLNYLDWALQEAGKKYDVLTKHNIPIFVMEPVRGGLLASPGSEAEALLKAARPSDTAASWAFRFLQSLPGVYIVVSGMSTMHQLKENIEIFGVKSSMSEAEKAILQKIVDSMAEFVPCTDCRYCCSACPQKLDIPMLIALYNEASHDVSWTVTESLDMLTEDKKPQACTGCGACNQYCPQNIDIADTMKKFYGLLKAAKKAK